MGEPASTKLTFRHAARLHGRRAFGRVFAARARKALGPIAMHAMPNGLALSRLGLSVSRRVGSAVRRNRIKRLVREAFRLDRPTLPGGYDWVIVVHPHEPLTLAAYRDLLARGAGQLDRLWQKRGKTSSIERADATPGDQPTTP